MAIYRIVQEGDPILREIARKVPEITENIHKLLDNMAETMYDADGVGLAAPQVGVSKRIIVVDAGEGIVELINPLIVRAEGTEVSAEGCLSVPQTSGEVPRAAKVVVEGWDRHGKKVTHAAEGLFARVLQHEIDHLEGILFTDRAINIDRS